MKITNFKNLSIDCGSLKRRSTFNIQKRISQVCLIIHETSLKSRKTIFDFFLYFPMMGLPRKERKNQNSFELCKPRTLEFASNNKFI